jgi:hypothetical protein
MIDCPEQASHGRPCDRTLFPLCNATIVPLLSETMSLRIRVAELDPPDRALGGGASAQSDLTQVGHGVTSKEVRIPIA